MNDFIERSRRWQKSNPEWQLHCDIKNTNNLYTQWGDLSRSEREYWDTYEDPQAAFEEFGIKTCKVEKRVLDCNMNMHEIKDWPYGNAMVIYRNKI